MLFTKLRTVAANCLLSFASLIVFFLVVEGTCYVFGQRPLLEDETISEWEPFSIKLNLCETDPDAVANTCHRPDAAGYVEAKFRGTPMLFAYGGSSLVWSEPVEDPEFLDMFAQKMNHSKKRIATFNLGASCKDSHFARVCYNATKEMRPQYILIYAGHNDVINLGFLNPQTMIFQKEHPWFLRSVQFLQTYSRFYAVLSKLALKTGVKKTIPDFRNVTREEFRRNQQAVIDFYLKNVEFIVTEAAKYGGTVLLATTINNLQYTPRVFPNFTGPLVDATRQTHAKGMAAFAAKDYELAFKLFIQAREEDPFGQRALTGMNEGLRRLAEKHENALLIDIEKKFYAKTMTEGVGCNYFGNDRYCDHTHPNMRAKRIIADILYDAILPLVSAK